MKPQDTNPWRRHPAYSMLLLLDLAVLLPHLPHMQPLVSLLLALLWSWAAAWKLGRLPLPNPWSKVALTLMVALIVLGRHQGVLGLEGGSALLAVMLLMKSLEIRRRQDFDAAIVALLFLIISLLFRDQGWWNALYGALLGLGMLQLMHLLARPAGSGVKASALGATARMRRRWPRLLLTALPLAAALFILFPRLAQPLWGLPLDSSRGKTGLSEQLSPGDLGNLFMDETPVFRASEFEPAMPPPEGLYWRAMVMWHFDGRSWKRALLPNGIPRAEVKGKRIEYTLINEAYSGNWRVALDYPQQGGYSARLSPDGQWVTRLRWQPAGEHRLVSVLDARPGRLHPLERHWGLQLPEQGNPQARAWARQLRRESRNDAELLARLLQTFNRQPFYYSLTPPPLGRDTVDEFLFQTRTGYCEHYASALVFVLRAAGIPARVVTGYLGGEYNPLGKYILVRKSDAHAWAEVWLEGEGWVRVDPTAQVAPERVQTDIRQLRQADRGQLVTPVRWLRQRLDWLAYRWNRWFLRYNYQLQQQVWATLSDSLQRLSPWWLLLLLSLPVWKLLRHLQRRDRLLALYQRLVRELNRLPTPPPPGLGPERLADWCRLHLAEGEAVYRWLHAWMACRYGHSDPADLRAPPAVPRTIQPVNQAGDD